jgi:hypothetical protein
MYEFEDKSGFDISRYKKLLESDSSMNKSQPEYTDAEIIEEYHDSSDDGSSILDNATSKGFDRAMQRVISKSFNPDIKSIRSNDDVTSMLSKLFDDLNRKYGLDVKLDFNSFTHSLEFIIQPKNKRALELYLSEAYSRIRVLLYGQYLNAIVLLSSQILNPDYLLSESMSYEGKLAIVRELYSFMKDMNQIYKEVEIENSELKIQKLAEEDSSEDKLTDPDVLNFLESLTKSLREGEGNK